MDNVEAIALRAGGLGPGAGRYLKAHQLAELSGRDSSEIEAIKSSILRLGGTVHKVGPLRDALSACFDSASGSALVDKYPPAPSPNRKRHLLSDLMPMRPKTLGSLIADSLHAALAHTDHGHGHLIHQVWHIAPGESKQGKEKASSLSQDPIYEGAGTGRHLQTRIFPFPSPPKGLSPSPPHPPFHPAPPSPSPPSSIPKIFNPIQLNGTVHGPYPGSTLQGGDPMIGMLTGITSPSLYTALGMPYFYTDTAVVYAGTSNFSFLMQNAIWRKHLVSVMLPCSANLSRNEVLSVSYASASSPGTSCYPQSINISFYEDYRAFNKGTVFRSFAINPITNATALSVMSCGQAVANANGILDSTFCATTLGRQVAMVTGAANDISNNTILFTINTISLGIPANSVLINPDIMFTLPDTVPFRYRVVAIPYTPAVPYLTSGPNHPIHVLKDWLNGSKASLNLGGAKGTIMAPGFTLGSAGYNFSPFDLASANNGLGLPTPTVVNLTHPPDFVANNPRALYGPPNIAATDSFQLATEATLDIQMMSQYAQGSGATDGFFSPNASMSPAEAYNNTFLLGQLEMILLSPPPDVITLSEGGPQLASNLMTSLSKLAAQGVTVIASSGDSGPFMNLGSGGLYTATCKDAVLPSYPAASPWVTAVGSVMQLRTSPNNSKPQLVATMSLAGSFCSGGGFGILDSHIPSSPLPKWQKKVVLNYIANQSGHPSWPLNTKFNPLTSYSVNISSCSLIDKMTGKISGCSYGRGYPDLALMGQSIPIVTSGQFGFVGGTSASAPAFAGLVAQLNSAVRSTPGLHNQTMGWMNPFLYWAAENYPNAFTDITIGSSNQDSSGNVCLLGYRAAVGWDAVSGLGVPNIAVLQQAAIKYVTLQIQGSIAPYFYNYYNVEYDPNAGGTYGGPPSDYDYYAAGKK